jgi:hypothetical protein
MSMMPAMMSMMPRAFVVPLVPVVTSSSVSGSGLQTSGGCAHEQRAAE